MHEYSICGFSKNKVVFGISVLSVILAPWLTSIIAPFLNKISFISGIPEIGRVSVSGGLFFVFLWFLFSNLIWRLPIIKHFLNIPFLSGTWVCSGTGKKYADPVQVNNWDGIVIIEQTLDKILITLRTQNSQSRSQSVLGNLERCGKNEYILTYFYKNEPFDISTDLRKHYGFCRITFNMTEKTATGTYYTDSDRGSYGTMHLKRELKNA